MFSIFNRRAGGSEGDFSPANSSPSSAMSPSPSPQSSAPIVTGPARPIRLVYCDEKGKFKMDPEAVAVLQLVKEPVGIVSVCGRARQGKSFILNQLLGRSSGFQVASTHRPCTKGLWLWSAPLKRTALDGTTYNLLLIDSEGIDAYDQTGTYSTQIFSLAVLLSSMFIYNQMGGIDEAALDRLSLVTQMTKHIRVKASGGRSSASELGQLSPIFVWLLRDFYLDLVEDNRRITPRDYLEIALRPVQGSAKDVSAKNEIRDSIRALFPDRECYTLVRPLNNENDLQRLDQIPLEKLRPEFRSGLDALTKFVFERCRPKQVFGTVMTGPILVGITESYLEALNNGAVPTISSSWQSVEEAECRRAYEMATEAYMTTFDRSKPPDESYLREAHEEATQKALSVFNNGAVGVGATRKKFESLLHKFFKKAFEDYKKNVFAEADTQCANAIQNMERKLRTACHANDASIDKVVNVLTTLVSEYETSFHGPNKWQKLSVFLQQSAEGPIRDVVKKLTDQIGMEKSSLALKLRSIEDRTMLLNKQLEASEKNKAEFMKRYDEAINDKKKVTDDYLKRISDLQSSRSSLDERLSGLAKNLEASRTEAANWKRKYDATVSKMKSDEEHLNSEIGVFKSRCSAAEARLAAAQEQTKAAQEEASEWRRKFDVTLSETKLSLEKANAVQERSAKETQLREDSLRKEFGVRMAQMEGELKEKSQKLNRAEQLVGPLRSELTAAESKIKAYEGEIASMKEKLNTWISKVDSANMKMQNHEARNKMLEQEKNHLEVELQSQIKRCSEIEERCRSAEKEARKASESAERARNEAAAIQKEKASAERASMERLANCERAQREIDALEREKQDLALHLKNARESEGEAVAKVGLLESRVEERESEIEMLLKKDNVERAQTVKSLQDLLERERRAHQEANKRAQEYSVSLEEARAKVDNLQRELTSVKLCESALDSKLRSASHGKRSRGGDHADHVEPTKRTRVDDVAVGDDSAGVSRDHHDYTKFTVQRLKQELTSRNFGQELLELRNPSKKDIVALYEKCVLHKHPH